MTKRVNQVILVFSVLGFSWLAMQAVHELGHVIGAWMTGGHVTRVTLHPAVFSKTDVLPNPNPTLVAWMGPIVGSLLPVLVLLALWPARRTWLFMLRFFAGFCLIANGLYLAIGSFDNIGDAGDLLLHGSPAWQLIAFGVVTVPAGLCLWHGQGESFGLGQAKGQVAREHVLIALSLFMAILLGELLWGLSS